MKPILIAVAALFLSACATTKTRSNSLEEVPAEPAQAQPAASEPVAADPAEAPTEALPCALTRVHFAFDSNLLDAAARDALAETARCIAQKRIPVVVIEGHADERGTEAYNIALGQRRAESVRSYLKKLGVGARLDAVSFGEAYPIGRAPGEEGWALDRRAELRAPGEKLSDGERVVPGR